jgi:hypothetical protein
MEHHYKNFVATFYKFLYDINRYVPTSEINQLLPKYKDLDMVKVLYRVHKLLKNNEQYIQNSNTALFNQDFYILPAINLSSLWRKMNPNQQKKVWTYLSMLLLQTDIFYDVQEEKKEPIVTVEEKTTEFNPYVGIGNSNQNYCVNDILCSIPTVEEDEPMDLGRLDMMMKMTGLDKMLNMQEITSKLKNMTDEDLDKYTEELKIAFGAENNPNVSNFVVDMMEGIKEVKKDDELSLPKMLQTMGPMVQASMEENNLDNTQLLNSAKNFAKQHREAGGQPLFGGIDPFAMIEKLTGNGGPVDEKQAMKDCNDMLKQIGMGHINPADMQGMSMQQMMGMVSGAGRGQGKKMNKGKKRK